MEIDILLQFYSLDEISYFSLSEPFPILEDVSGQRYSYIGRMEDGEHLLCRGDNYQSRLGHIPIYRIVDENMDNPLNLVRPMEKINDIIR